MDRWNIARDEYTMITPTPAGWLVRSAYQSSSGSYSESMCHVPDPEHLWSEARDACGMPPVESDEQNPPSQ